VIGIDPPEADDEYIKKPRSRLQVGAGWNENLVNDMDGSADFGPVVEPAGIINWIGLKVNAAVRHRTTKVVMPVGTVETVPTIKVHRVWHIFQEIGGAISHISKAILDVDMEVTIVCGKSGCSRQTSGDNKGLKKKTIFESVDTLGGEDDDDLFAYQKGGLWRNNWLRIGDNDNLADLNEIHILNSNIIGSG